MPARRTRPAAGDDAAARLAALSESLSDVLGADAPFDALVERLALATRATVALLDRDGGVQRGSGTLPQALVAREVARATAFPHLFDVDGWIGVLHHVASPDDAASAPRWLVAASRREGFPTSMDRAALAVGGGLLAAMCRTVAAEARQARAARAGILERALELHLRRDDPELAARCADAGIDFADEARVLVMTAARQGPRSSRPLAALAAEFERTLRIAGITELTTVRNEQVVVLAQATGGDLRRRCVAAGLDGHAHCGIGRRVTSVGAIVDSYHDAHLGARVIRGQGGHRSIVSYEEFDFATRLFADIGLDTMAAWAAEYLAPLDGRDPFVVALTTYFASKQSVKVAARKLGIHQNSMRYRLAKVEELLRVDLADPAAVASIHLALTAMDLADPAAAISRAPVPRRGAEVVHDADSPEAATRFDRPLASDFGAAFGPSP
jgi:hypothetical protein